jgi:hypothetical protein
VFYLVGVDFLVGGQLDVLQVAWLRLLQHEHAEVVLVGGHSHVLALVEAASGAVPPVVPHVSHSVPVTDTPKSHQSNFFLWNILKYLLQFLHEWKQKASMATMMAELKAMKAAIIICSEMEIGLRATN